MAELSSTTVYGDLKVTGDVYANGNVTAYSDFRLKDIVRVIDDPIEKLRHINGYYYKRKDKKGELEIGLIAQEVQSVLPELVHTLEVKPDSLIPDGELLTLDYAKTVAFLVEVCKRQQDEIDKLTELVRFR